MADMVSRVLEHTLPNGLKVLILPRPFAPVVSMVTYADVGSVDENQNATGLAHIFEHMAFKGTTTVGTTDIARELERLLAARAGALARTGRAGGEAARRLARFAARGKMVRGGLLVLGWRMHGGEAGPVPRRVVLRAAAALELLHSALLVHDDIMDGDRLRRGEPTVHARYEDEARRAGAVDPERTGMALGVSAGDLAIFAALDEIAALEVDPALALALARRVGGELALVGAGQFEDVALGAGRGWPSRAAVLAVYTYKTARYTFSLPLACGALLAGARPAAVARLERIGEILGTVFQILDDERHPDAKLGRDGNRTVGSLYDLIPAPKDKTVSPMGEWNHARVLAQGNHVEFWLNGVKTVEFERGSARFRELVAASKYKSIAGFGEWTDGHILLQDLP